MYDTKFVADKWELLARTRSQDGFEFVDFELNADVPCVLHWGLRGIGDGWRRPPENIWPEKSHSADALSLDTPFQSDGAGKSRLTIRMESPAKSRAMAFVLFFPESKRWVKDGHKDYYLSLRSADAKQTVADISDAIEDAEVRTPSWSLMHRFNLCFDLLNDVRDYNQVLPLFFVWLRFSAIRQLDWQRQFNTKPRELSHSMDRLTSRMAGLLRQRAAQPFWIRQVLSTLGRGGEGQQVRDEILNIMHRNHIKETHGKFMEEWHQKLHNNTTSDDVVICEAFLAFLESKGDLKLFYSTLERNGVTRDRLRSFERPIKTDPDYHHDSAGALINDFKRYLTILKALHSGTDFDSAFSAASRHLSSELKKELSDLGDLRRSAANALAIAQKLTPAREALAASMSSMKDDAPLRDVVFLDMALEEFLRKTVESQNSEQGIEGLSKLLDLALRNALLTIDNDDLRCCSKHWTALMAMKADSSGWALHAISVTSRIGRVVQDVSSSIYSEVQPKAETLGKAFKAQVWTIPIFSEEVIRGSIVFVLALLLRRLGPQLRKSAGLGGWQVVSANSAKGKVRVVESLMSVQGQRFAEPTVLVTEQVSGNEDIPEGVTAVITIALIDLVSHSAVRARNGHILCATCFDSEPFATLKKSEGQWIALEVKADGDVRYQPIERDAQTANVVQALGQKGQLMKRRSFTSWAIGSAEFNSEVVGGKSNNLNALRGRMPEWISFPKSMALPFGVFEKLLDQDENRNVRSQYDALVAVVESNVPATLAKIRALILELNPTSQFESALRETWSKAAFPALNWNEAWSAIKRVWASKWNDRAYLSRRALGIAHPDLMMAVLIQEVVEAEYAFVLHTANPISSNREEVFGEIVLGLGETLVGNHPGSAMGFVFSKRDGSIKIISYPSKSFGLFSSGLIFRSDSNGEDLEDFAGAGLYDSILGREAEQRRLEYSREPLVWDAGFRETLISKIARVGIEAEKIFDAPQDIEGAVRRDQYCIVQSRPQVGLKNA